MNVNTVGRVTISVIVVAGFLGVTLIYMTQKLNGETTPDILTILLGALATNFTSVVGYWIGSSASSSSKDATIQTIVEEKATQ